MFVWYKKGAFYCSHAHALFYSIILRSYAVYVPSLSLSLPSHPYPSHSTRYLGMLHLVKHSSISAHVLLVLKSGLLHGSRASPVSFFPYFFQSELLNNNDPSKKNIFLKGRFYFIIQYSFQRIYLIPNEKRKNKNNNYL